MSEIAKPASSVEGDPDFSIEAVPDTGRMSKWSLMMAYWALCSAAFWLVVSATLASQFGALNTIIALVACIFSYGILGNIIARFAIKTGLSVDLFSRSVYGKVGGLLATAIFFSTAVYYCVFEGSVIAIAFQSALPALEMWHAYLIVVLYSVPLVFGGIAAYLDKFNAILLPFYILGLVALIIVAVANYGYNPNWYMMGENGGVIDERVFAAFVYYMGISINLMFSWDYSRFGRKEDVDFHARINFGMPFYLATFFGNGIIGIFLAATVPLDGTMTETKIVYVILSLLGLWGVLFLWVSQTRINTANFQEATVNLQAFLKHIGFARVSKVTAALIIGLFVYAFMLTDVFSFLLAALAYQGVFVVAWVAIAVTHILNSKPEEVLQKYRETEAKPDLGLTHPSFIVWLVASACGVFALITGGTIGSYAAPITAFLSVTLYLLALRSIQRRIPAHND